MKREQALNILTKGWLSLERKFKSTSTLYESNFVPPKMRNGQSKGYDQKSSIRIFGAEPYLQATFFTELTRICENSSTFVLSVEGKNLNGKRPDLLGWNPQAGQEEPYFVVELKVVGSDLFYQKNEDGHFKIDVLRYSQSDVLTSGKSLFFFGCFYESDPEDILILVKKHGSILNWLIETQNITFPEAFRNSVVEGYAFRGDNDWIVIDNCTI